MSELVDNRPRMRPVITVARRLFGVVALWTIECSPCVKKRRTPGDAPFAPGANVHEITGVANHHLARWHAPGTVALVIDEAIDPVGGIPV